MRFTRPALVAVLALLVAPTVAAQASQYTAPGGGTTRPPGRDEIEAQMEQARWRLGPFRLAPWLALRSLTYEDNVFVAGANPQSDLHGSLGAGLTVYLPTGPDVFWVAQALPEYLFWLDLDDRNQVVGRYGAGVFADFNRLRLTVDGQSVEQQDTVSSEAAQQVIAGTTAFHGAAELRLSGAFALGLDAAHRDLEYRLPDDSPGLPGLPFASLDREERTYVGELIYRPGAKVELAAGAERTEVEFDASSRDLSSTGTSPFVRLALDGNRLDVDARLIRRDLEPEPGSLLAPVDQTEGSARATLELGNRLTLGAYGSRTTAYALAAGYTQFTSERTGTELGFPLNPRLALRAFFETGSDDYLPLPGNPARSDDVTVWGGDAELELGEWLSYRLGLQQVEYDSNLPAFDRDYLRVLSTLVLSTGDWVWQ